MRLVTRVLRRLCTDQDSSKSDETCYVEHAPEAETTACEKEHVCYSTDKDYCYSNEKPREY